MSLRAFHLFFVTFITLFCAAVAVWVFKILALPSQGLYLAGWSCGALAVITPVYGAYFYQKMKKHSL